VSTPKEKNMKTIMILLALSSNVALAKSLVSSFYADKFNGKTTASGEKFIQSKHTAASNHYKFGTILMLFYNGKSTRVCINDTGGFTKYHRDIDVSKSVAKKLKFDKKGVVSLKSKVVYAPKKRMECKQSWLMASR